MSDETVPGMAEAIEARRKHEGLSPTALRQASGLTLEGLSPVRAGLRRAYQARTRIGVARALRWPEDWYDRLDRGEDPASFPDVDWPEVRSNEDRLVALEAEVAAIRADLQQLLREARPPAT